MIRRPPRSPLLPYTTLFRSGLAQALVGEVLGPHLLRLPLRLPLGPAVLEIPEQFLLLGVHRDDRLPAPLAGPDPGADELELGIAVRVGGPLARLAVALQAVAQVVQQQGDRLVADVMALPPQLLRQHARALTGPAQRRHRVAPGGRV